MIVRRHNCTNRKDREGGGGIWFRHIGSKGLGSLLQVHEEGYG